MGGRMSVLEWHLALLCADTVTGAELAILALKSYAMDSKINSAKKLLLMGIEPGTSVIADWCSSI